jgi:TRAP-type C4-dicarboxylate transport system substrate-binding protein
MKREKKFGLVAILLSVFLIVGFSVVNTELANAADKVFKWKCPSLYSAGSSEFKNMVAFSNMIKKKTNGRLIITLYGAGSLMPTKEIFNAVKVGMIEMGATSCAYMRSQVPLAIYGYGMPMNFKEYWESLYFRKVIGLEDMLRKDFAKHGIYYAGAVVLPGEFALTKPIRNLKDFKGKKLRTAGLLQKYVTQIGAAGTYIPGEDVYTALSTGVLDGAMWGGMTGNNDLHFYEICKYHLKLNLSFGGWSYIVNQKAIKKLPKDVQDVLLNALDEEIWRGAVRNAYDNRKMEISLKKKGIEIIEFPAADRKKMVAEAVKLWDKEVGKKSPECAKLLEKMKKYINSLGYLE